MRRTLERQLVGWVPSLLMVALSSCAEESSSQPVDEVREFAVRVAQIVCEKAAPCCAEFALPKITEECNLQMRNEVYISFIEAEGDGRQIDLATKDTCIGRFDGATSCEDLPFPFELLTVCPELFSEIPEGKRSPGDVCEGVYDCASPAAGERFCLLDGGKEKTCVWLVPTADGEACNEGDGIYGDCADELVCGFAAETGQPPFVCTDPALPEAVCYSPGTCVDGYVCLEEPEGSFCREALPLGAPCLDTPDLCSFPAACDVVDGVCAPLPIVQTCEDAICSSELIEVCQ